MASVIIQKKDLETLGKKLMKEFYYHVHDEYLLSFDEVKKEKDYYEKNIVDKFLNFYEHKEKNYKNLYFGNKRYEEIVKMSHKDLLEKIEDEIKNETLNVEIIYRVLDGLKLDHDLDEDLFYMKNAFIYIFKVYHYYHSYLDQKKISKGIDEDLIKSSFNIIKNAFSNIFEVFD